MSSHRLAAAGSGGGGKAAEGEASSPRPASGSDRRAGAPAARPAAPPSLLQQQPAAFSVTPSARRRNPCLRSRRCTRKRLKMGAAAAIWGGVHRAALRFDCMDNFDVVYFRLCAEPPATLRTPLLLNAFRAAPPGVLRSAMRWNAAVNSHLLRHPPPPPPTLPLFAFRRRVAHLSALGRRGRG